MTLPKEVKQALDEEIMKCVQTGIDNALKDVRDLNKWLEDIFEEDKLDGKA